ncbi:hypothetical protein B0H10DRAFT_2324854 [Mycena sp. CBHHK59/15]|nr:hypothetical protein B0H10DRAFT_2324854 [Mycena sp. CBHHK59/15]
MDKGQQEALLKLHQRFITEEAFSLTEFDDGVNTVLPDQSSVEWQTWYAHGAALITAWELMVKDGTAGEWPEIQLPLSSEVRSTPGNTVSQLNGESTHNAERLRCALEDSGVLPADGEVGPVHQAKSIYARCIEKLKNAAKGKNGLKRDFLADECVIAGTASATRRDGTTKKDTCTWCIACDKNTVGHDPVRIKTHAHQCQTLQAKYHDLWILVNHERGGSSLSTALEEGNSNALPAVCKAVETPASQAVPNPAASTPGASQGIHEYFTPTKIMCEGQAQIDLLLFKFIICCAIPFSLLGSPFFIEFVLALAPNYKVPERLAFFARHITSEVAAVGQKAESILEHENTYDLLTGRLEVCQLPVKHFALCNVVKGILETFNPRKYSTIAGDGGPNDLGALFKKTKFLKGFLGETSAHYTFMANLSTMIQLLRAPTNGILTLEGQNTTCADVFYVWVCIAWQLEKMMDESSCHIFLLAYFSIQLTMPTCRNGEQLTPAQYLPLFVILFKAAMQVLKGEQQRVDSGGKEEAVQLKEELIRYTCNQTPFDSQHWDSSTKPLDYWTKLSNDSNAKQIGRISVKIFSIMPSEICDEHTASRLSWFNAAHRSSILPENLISCAQLYNHYTNKTDHLNFGPAVVRSQTVFVITQYIKLESPALAELMEPSKMAVSTVGSTAAPSNTTPAGHLDDWNMDDFLA